MSNSRLEKFIYAICGMEVDDLPTPLSRIETLWNCLITGGMPDFEPLSRNEKYLMAMLTDNVDGLPEPTSRGEKLLYKIATGETDLSDVPGYLSRYEELLKQLIENGGIGGTDFEYVLYTLNDSFSTLYTTAEAPVKSAILSGNTLVNLLETEKEKYTFNNQQNWVVEDGYLKCNGTSSWHTVTDKFNDMIKPSTKYLLRIEIVENTLDMILNFDGYGTNIPQSSAFLAFAVNEVGVKSHIVTTAPELDSTKNGLFRLPINIRNGGTLKIRFMAIEYQEGMENWDIPYFEGMQSVKMPVLTTTGKNIFSPTKMAINDGALYGYYKYKDDESVRCTLSISDKDTSVDISGIYFGMSKLGKNADGGVVWLISNGSVAYPEALAIAYNHNFISIYPNNTETLNKLTERFNIQLEHSEAKTTYEPFKTNILSCNEEVTLCGIGDVKDTLDGNTGELTQRIGEVVLDGSEDEEWESSRNITIDGVTCMHIHLKSLPIPPINYVGATAIPKIICDKGVTDPFNGIWMGKTIKTLSVRADFGDGMNYLCMNFPVNEDIKTWLSKNPMKVQYISETPIIKTVNLSITDQDGQPTKLSTFNDITHVSIEAEDLLPTVDLEVPTKIEETLSTLPTLMNDISETQQLLNESIDDQAENVNEVSTAMTEIRNDIL